MFKKIIYLKKLISLNDKISLNDQKKKRKKNSYTSEKK